MRLRTFGGLWIENPRVEADSGVRPRGLALLAILAAAGGSGVSRDRVLGILWPESDAERARHALSQTLYGLRRALGVEVVLSTPELRLDSSKVASDVEQFRGAVRARQWSEAAALFVGPFVDGFYLADAPEFERWAEKERATLASDGIRAVESLATEAERAGDAAGLVEHRRRLTLLDPYNPRFAVAYMEALARQGNREAALAHGKAHVSLLHTEFDAEPDRAVQQMMERLRANGVPARGGLASSAPAQSTPSAPSASSASSVSSAPPALSAPPAPPALSASSASSAVSPAPAPLAPSASFAVPPATRPRARTWRSPFFAPAAAVALVILAASTAVAWRETRDRTPADRPILAVGRIRDLVAPDSGAVGAVLSEMLSTSLGRIPDLRVVANSRMLELTPRGGDTSRAAVTDAARRAGATELVEGELLPLPDRQLRVEIRRVDLRLGLVRAGYRVAGSDRFALFDSVTALIAADFRVDAPTGSLAEVSTRSPIAYRFYDEGLRAFYQFDPRAALRFFRSAMREDSTFAMAAYYTWRAALATGDSETPAFADHVLDLAPHASTYDRLLIMTHVGANLVDPRALAAAESLAANYSHDSEALIRAAEVLRDFGRSVQLLNRSIALDSAAGVAPSALCRMCDAFYVLSNRYASVDSLDASTRTLQRWIRVRPRDAMPWCVLGDLYVSAGRRDSAEAANRRCDALGGSWGNRHLVNLTSAMRLDDLDDANQECRAGLASTDLDEFEEFRWFCTLALRMQGRMREAMSLARDGRARSLGLDLPPRGAAGPNPVNVPVLLMEARNPAAIPLFRRMYARLETKDKFLVGIRARNATWTMTLAATAAVAAGDTTRARAYVDSIQSEGQQSLYARDPVLHHFVRGLLYSRAGQHERAVEEYRDAMVLPTFGYTRINYELARSLLALGRPAEAIPVLRSALHGGIEGSNLYVTRPELHELLAQSFAAAGQRDSAAAHFAIVERAWRFADPPFRARYDAARRYVSQAGRTAIRTALPARHDLRASPPRARL